MLWLNWFMVEIWTEEMVKIVVELTVMKWEGFFIYYRRQTWTITIFLLTLLLALLLVDLGHVL